MLNSAWASNITSVLHNDAVAVCDAHRGYLVLKRLPPPAIGNRVNLKATATPSTRGTSTFVPRANGYREISLPCNTFMHASRYIVIRA